MPKKIPDEKPPTALTLWTVARAPDGGIVCEPCVVTGPIQIGALARPVSVPPEWLERCIPLNLEAASWR
ncbi:MAG: hypothetical protein ACREIA_19425 [Opitutaceae bacterium]